ncbi:MAG: type II toxin-antitoxin system HicA family toxin [Clostridia bacterium]|nr:type II toxin-antitoxin system HicA family toxin [Clostridia bacterium]
MSRKEKILKRLKSKPKDFTYDEARTLLLQLGFEEDNKGKTSGSRVIFRNIREKISIDLHKPHPNNVLKEYQIIKLIKDLKRWIGNYE